jgi:Transposase DDE domain
LEGFLTAHVSALLHPGIIELHSVAQDGMRTRASAGAGSFHRVVTIEECQKLVEEQLAELKRKEGESLDAVAKRQLAAQKRHAEEKAERLKEAKKAAQELEAKQAERRRVRPKETKEKGTTSQPGRASTTDPEACRMKMGDGGTRPAFNMQCATTIDTKIIVAVDVTNQGSDGGLLGPMLQQIEEAYGEAPKTALVDGGFASKADVEAAHANGTEVYSPLKGEKKALEAGKDPYAPKAGDQEGMKAFRARMKSEEAKKLYQKRGETAEWVFAGMRQRGLSQFWVRGLSKVRAVAMMQALVHNLWQTKRLLDAKDSEWNWTEILRAEIREPQFG